MEAGTTFADCDCGGISSCSNCGSIDIICPSCGLRFLSSDVLIHHFNTDGTQCISSLEGDFGIPTIEEINVTGQYDGRSDLFGKGETLLDCLQTHEHERHRKHLIYYPFVDKGEWELAKFLALNLNKTQVSQFLKLRWVHLFILLYQSTHHTGTVRYLHKAEFWNCRSTFWLAGKPPCGPPMAIHENQCLRV